MVPLSGSIPLGFKAKVSPSRKPALYVTVIIARLRIPVGARFEQALMRDRCGLRIGEAMALNRSDIDLDAGLLTVSSSMSRREGLRPVKGRTHGDRGRTIPVPVDVVDRLRRHLAAQPVVNISGFLFTAPMGGPISYGNWRRQVWRKIVEQVGFEVRPHDLRHSASTRLFMADRWNPPEVQAYLGHRDPRTTLEISTPINAEQLPQPSPLSAVE